MNEINPKTRRLLEAVRGLRVGATTSPMADATRAWQRAGCPDLPAPADSWQRLGDVALEVLDQLEERMRRTPEATDPERLAHMLLELATDAEDHMQGAEVLDAMLQAVAAYTLQHQAHPAVAKVQPRVAVDTLKAHLVRMGARALGRGK